MQADSIQLNGFTAETRSTQSLLFDRFSLRPQRLCGEYYCFRTEVQLSSTVMLLGADAPTGALIRIRW